MPRQKSWETDVSLGVDFKQSREHQTVLIRTEGADVGREFNRQHGNSAVGEIDAGTS